MKKIFLALFTIPLLCSAATAQYTTVTYDYTKNYFNQGQPIPAEKLLMFTGAVPDNSYRVELSIFSHKGNNMLYQATWEGESRSNFSIPINYRLRSSDRYDFQMDYFSPISERQRDQLQEQVLTRLYNYVDANLKLEKKSFELEKSSKKMLRELNEILANMLINYRVDGLNTQLTLSEAIQQKLDQLEDVDWTKDIQSGDTARTKQMEQAATQQRDDLQAQLEGEVAQFFSNDLLVLTDSRYIDNYETEAKQSTLSINVGYGGVYLDGKLSKDLTYGDAPYVGLAIPLGNSTFAPRFLSNASLTLGIFTNNFEDENGNEVTGIIFDRPLYLGLDYKLFQFVHFNAGATLLETIDASGNLDGNSTQVVVRPFIGLGTRIDLNFSIPK